MPLVQKPFGDIITFSRGSNATMFDSSGTLVYAPNNAIRNNTMVGAVAGVIGSGGAAPTNWTVPNAGMTVTVTPVIENGISCIDINWSGTATATNSRIFFDNVLPAAYDGQTWVGSTYLKLAAGTYTESVSLRVTGPSATLDEAGTSIPYTSTLTRYNRIRTLAGGFSSVQVALRIQLTIGAVYDFTLRIGMPQLEIGPVATAVNATSGTAYQAPRLDYDPVTLLPRGFLVEEQRTNSIRNNTMQGAVAGTPGTNPTNWDVAVSGSGITREVVGTGTEDGITYIDLRFYGTGSGSATPQIRPETTTSIVSAVGQTWTASYYLRIVGGSTTGVTSWVQIWQERDAAGVALTNATATVSAPTTAALKTQQSVTTRTLTDAAAVRLTNRIQWAFVDGVAVDITIRIGLPQLELGAFATSVIPTTTTALTRSADVAAVNTLSPWYNQTEGALYAEYQTYSASVTQIAVALMDSSNGSSNRATVGQSATAYNGAMVDGGAVQASLTQGTTSTNVVKNAFAFAVNDFAFSVNGAAPATDTSGTVSSAFIEMQLGKRGSVSPMSGWLQRVTYYPRRVSNAELQALTA